MQISVVCHKHNIEHIISDLNVMEYKVKSPISLYANKEEISDEKNSWNIIAVKDSGGDTAYSEHQRLCCCDWYRDPNIAQRVTLVGCSDIISWPILW